MIPIIKGIVDSHSHYDDRAFDLDRDDVLSLLLDNENSEMDFVIHASVDEKSARFGIKTAEKYQNFYTSIGYHPEAQSDTPENYISILENLLPTSEKIVAVGEIGLDYHYDGYNRDFQIKVLCEQIEFAQKHNLPCIFHCRDATADFLEMMKKYKPKGVVHCFTGAPEVVKEYIDLGLYVGFTGVLTFKNSKKVKKSLAEVPLDRILLETDCPYMAPEPFRGKRCTSDMIKYIAQTGAEIKDMSAEQIVRITNDNTRHLFNIKI